MPPTMTSSILVVIRQDPRRSHRPVEALRIALGLAAGDHDVTVALQNDAARLLTDDTDDIVDADILEKYLPSFKQLGIPFIVTGHTSNTLDFHDGFALRHGTEEAVQDLLRTSDHALVF
jgi:hypothetical protein